MALQLTQKEFGDLFGKTKRTVQRWERHGALLFPDDVEPLVRALRPIRPDLADQVTEAARKTAGRIGLAPSASASGASIEERIDLVVRAAADAIGATPEAVRPAVGAAFARARDVGLDVKAVVDSLAGLDRRTV